MDGASLSKRPAARWPLPAGVISLPLLVGSSAPAEVALLKSVGESRGDISLSL